VPDRLEWIRDTRELEDLVPLWSALWRADPNAKPFQAPEWLLPWWRVFGADLRTVAMFREDQLIALLPFYRYVEPSTGERLLLPVGIGTTDYLEGLFAPECGPRDICRAIELLCSGDDWDTLHASQLTPASRLLEALEASLPGRRVATDACRRMPAVSLSELPQKIRHNAAYYRNRARRAGTLELATADALHCEPAFHALVRLHTERWQRSGQPGVFADQRVVRWQSEAVPLLERAGLLRLFTLHLNGETIAAFYCLIDPQDRPDRTLYLYLPGYSSAHADLSPGTVLTAMIIEQAAQEGVRTIDMLRGEEDYKKLWHTQPAPTFGFTLHRTAKIEESEIAA
jgi:CelD/BcsL family acetyltransferase involved in cellulose biosynthesis